MGRQPSGMGTKCGEPVQRPPIAVPDCRGCGIAVTDETTRWDDECQTFICTACGTDDPCGVSV